MRDYFLATKLEELEVEELVRLLENLERQDREAFALLKELIEDAS
jgi:hypothetical protein